MSYTYKIMDDNYMKYKPFILFVGKCQHSLFLMSPIGDMQPIDFVSLNNRCVFIVVKKRRISDLIFSFLFSNSMVKT